MIYTYYPSSYFFFIFNYKVGKPFKYDSTIEKNILTIMPFKNNGSSTIF